MRKKISILMLVVLVLSQFSPEYLLAKTEDSEKQNVNIEELEQEEKNQKEQDEKNEDNIQTEEKILSENPEAEQPIQPTVQSGEVKENPETVGVERKESLEAYYEPGYELNIEGKDIHFKVETPPEENGTLVIKLPPFFELTSVPSSQDEYTVSSSKEKIDEEDPILGGEIREVLTFRYKDVTSTVSLSFEMRQKEYEKKDDGISVKVTKLLSQAMIRAGKYPDRIPLNIDITLYDKEKTLLEEKQIEGTSELSEVNEMVFDYKEGEKPNEYDDYDTSFWNKGENRLPLKDSGSGISQVSLEKYHYPYSDVELMIPYDKGEKLQSFYSDVWEKIETKTYDGKKYLVGKYEENYLRSFQEYDFGASARPKDITLYYGEEILPNETLSFDSPVLLRYTYKGETVVKELYRMADYHVKEACQPGIFWTESYGDPKKKYAQVSCGKAVEVLFNVYNSYKDQPPLERENLILSLDYPYEVQPQKIQKIEILNGEKKEFDIKYTVVNNKTAEEKVISEKNVSAGYEFKLEENEYVSKIEIEIPKMEKKDRLYFLTDNLTMTKDKDGNDITEDKRVWINGTLFMDDEKIDDGTFYVDLKALKDQMKATISTTHPIMEDDDKASYAVAVVGLRARDKHTKDYEQVSFRLEAPKEIMSKVIGYCIEWGDENRNVFEGDIVVVYDTNLKENQSVSVKAEDIYEEKYLSLDLKDGEYVTDIRLEVEKIIGERLYKHTSGAPVYFAPVINTKRTYYDENGVERELLLNYDYEVSYKFSTKSLPAVNMTEENLSAYEQYTGYITYEIEKSSSTHYRIQDIKGENVSSGYRGDTVLCDFFDLQYMRDIFELWRFYEERKWPYNIHIKEKYYFENQLFYLEVLPGFEVTGLTKPSVLERKEKLDNGNNLYVFRLTSNSGENPMPESPDSIQAKLYIRPDAPIDPCNPIVGAGVGLEQYFKKYFPDYPGCEQEKSTFPYQIVQLENEGKNEFPENWNLSDGEKMYGMYYSFTKPSSSEAFTVRNVTTSTTQMVGEVSGLLKEDDVTFKEAQRETLGFSAFISASSNETLYDYTATFCIPEKGDVVQGKGNTYNAQYTLYGNGPMEVYLNENVVTPSEQGIIISYYDKDGKVLDVASAGDWDEVRQIKVHFNSLNNETVYELSMPLKSDAKTGEDTSDWKSYIGTYNQTGPNGELTYITPITYVYRSYSVASYFGLDKYETGSSVNYLPFNHRFTIYDENWGEIFAKELKADNYYVSQKFNAGGKKIAYIGFELEEGEREHYLPTLKKSTSDLPEGEENIHEFSDGRKIWYIEADEMDFVSDSMSGKYDALFIRKPEITAKDLYVAVGKDGKLDFSVAQPMNEDLVKEYKISVRLSEQDELSQKIAQITQKEDGYYAEGLKKGTVSYEVVVTNKQGTRFTQKANITVGDQLHDLLPHVGGRGSKVFAYAGILFIGGGVAVLLQKRKKRCH